MMDDNLSKSTTPQNQFRTLSQGVFPASSSFLLENPFRKLIKSPRTVLERLGLSENNRVLEIGAGSGYYSREVAGRLGSGNLTLLDIQAEMLELNLSSIDAGDRGKTSAVVADAASMPLQSDTFDVIYMVTTLGEIEKKENSIREIFRILNHGGLLSISEQRTDPDFLSKHAVIRLATDAGFRYESSFGWVWNYTVNFKK